MRYCVEFSRKPGTLNAVQQQRQCRIHVTARNEDEAIALASVEAMRSGVGRYFEINKVRKT